MASGGWTYNKQLTDCWVIVSHFATFMSVWLAQLFKSLAAHTFSPTQEVTGSIPEADDSTQATILSGSMNWVAASKTVGDCSWI